MCVHQESNVFADKTVSYERGRPMPMLRGAPGKVIFANLPTRTARSYFRECPEEAAAAEFGSDWETIKASFHRILRAGVCVARGEVDKDRVGIATALFGANKNVMVLLLWLSRAVRPPHSILRMCRFWCRLRDARSTSAWLSSLLAGPLTRPLPLSLKISGSRPPLGSPTLGRPHRPYGHLSWNVIRSATNVRLRQCCL